MTHIRVIHDPVGERLTISWKESPRRFRSVRKRRHLQRTTDDEPNTC
jgi:hypothetical protein